MSTPPELLLEQPEYPNREIVVSAVKNILIGIGENPERPGLKDTPERVLRMFNEIFAGYQVDLPTLINNAIFDVSYDDLVIVKDIEFYSLCEHHMLPFWGRVHVGYVPDQKVIGLSKIPRLIDAFARRLQIQEQLTRQVSDAIAYVLNPKGVAVVIEAYHLCAMMRGVKKHSHMVTTMMTGAFQENNELRNEFLVRIK